MCLSMQKIYFELEKYICTEKMYSTFEHGLQYTLLQCMQIFFAITTQSFSQHIFTCDLFGDTIEKSMSSPLVTILHLQHIPRFS